MPLSLRFAKHCVSATAGLAAVLMLAIGAATVDASQAYSDTGLGSVNDYLKNSQDSSEALEFRWLGIEVKDGAGTLNGRSRFDGVEVLAVLTGRPGATAGLRGERVQIQAALTVGLLAASLFFPPAMLGVAVIGSSGIGKSQELIIAVDGERTHDVNEFGQALKQAKPGEVVYLTVVRDGQHKQLRVAMPDEPDSRVERP